MSLVLDASATLAWVYGEETDVDLDFLYEFAGRWGAVVPQLWHLEVVNILLLNHRRGKHDLEFVDRRLLGLRGLLIAVDEDTQVRAWGETARLAVKHSLTSYDSAYLELALRRGLPLATLDKALLRAAALEGVRLFWS